MHDIHKLVSVWVTGMETRIGLTKDLMAIMDGIVWSSEKFERQNDNVDFTGETIMSLKFMA